MLRKLDINNIALIDHLELDFEEGMTVLSGETGSGKSIIIDSLAFALGERADKTLIKYGEETAEVTALFDVEPNCKVVEKLVDYGFGDDTELLISRKMSVSGKNEIRIQGKTSTLAILKDICEELVDIFGQSQHLNLLNEKNQLATLDAFCSFGDINTKLHEQYSLLQSVNKELKTFGGSDAERQRSLDILRYQIDEIENADISIDEEEELEQSHKRIVNSERFVSALSGSQSVLDGESGAVSQLATAVSFLHTISGVDSTNDELAHRLDSVRIEAEDILESLNDMLEQCDYSEAEVNRIESRRDTYRELKRKYGGSVEDVLKFLAVSKSKYDNLSNSEEKIAELTARQSQILKTMFDLASEKSEIRHKQAIILANSIMNELNDLGMKGTSFEVSFSAKPSFDEYSVSPSNNGYDVVEFLMSANVGEPLKPLSKVISGGEMSRFMLAVKNITALAEKIPTMVFDEIDTGISGSMAQKVATKLANVSNSHSNNSYQCVVITHLPQIVAMADVNMVISKNQIDGRTITNVNIVKNDDDKCREIARLMGGVGEHALVNAKELLDWSTEYKKSIR